MNSSTVAKIAVENTAYSFDMLFEYSVPQALCDDVTVGKRVLVPFGNTSKKRVGVVFSLSECDESSKKLKSIHSVIDEEPLLTKEMLLTANYIREQTFCTYFDACKMFLPLGYSMKIHISYALNNDFVGDFDFDEEKIVSFLKEKNAFVDGESILKNCKIKNNGILDNMVSKKMLLCSIDKHRRTNDATVKMVRPLVDLSSDGSFTEKITKKQLEVLRVLNDVGPVSVKEICYFTGFTANVVTALETKGLVELYDDEVYRSPYTNVDSKTKSEIILSDEQYSAYNGLLKLYEDSDAHCALLYGVTGSGKTQVYLKLIDKAVESNKGVIVLIPEISLTPQILSQFYERYGDSVAVFHSALSLGQRLDEWKRVKRGEAKIAVGTRSAVFAPFDDIGLIIIDEEQEHTYKSEMTPRYHARDVAGYRIGKHNGLLLLASATPSIDSFTKAQNGTYSLFELKNRYGNAILPSVEIIDTTYRSDMVGDNISKRLAEELKANFDAGKQSILLLNRRGYNTFAKCQECGTVLTCPNCSISLTYHIKNNRLMCHYCGYSVPFTKKCTNCNNDAVRFNGSGTQKLEEEMSLIVPNARILRMDTDTTISRFSYEEKFKSFANREYDILVGTQMIAKGLDFPNVTLVGVLSVDQMLFNDDYKSGERAFDLITQVIGRSGRGDFSGKAFIQTSFSDSEIITLAKAQNFSSFYNIELPIRKSMAYPPFCDICAVGFSGDNEFKVLNSAKTFLESLKTLHSENYNDLKIIVLGPVVPRMSKIAGKYRCRILIKCRNSKRLREMIGLLLKSFTKNNNNKDVGIYAELNPESLM